MRVRLQAIAVLGSMLVVYGAVLFGSAGRLDLPMFWAVMAVWTAGLLGNSLTIDADLLRERLGPGPGIKEHWFRPAIILLFLAHLATAGIEVGRLGPVATVPMPVRIAALAGVAGVIAMAIWCEHVNPFFSSVVRIQRERGQRVISEGPYRWVRHPAYAALTCMPVFTGLALGSPLSLLLAPPIALVIVGRTVVEDCTLRSELPGYEEFASRVRYRLVPGVW